MALSAFGDKTAPPLADALAATLGPGYPWWNEVLERAASMCAPFSAEWGFTSASTGWGLRLKRGSRVIVYLTPCDGFLLASFALGDRAVRAARAGEAPDAVVALLDGARRYAEGTAVRLEVRHPEDVGTVLALVALKLAF